MRTISILRSGMLALAFAAAVTTIGPAFAAPDQEAMQSQQAQSSSTGPYDGADFEAAKHAVK
jgi:hypothetical protein